MASHLTRIFSDLHYGDRASTLRHLSALTPLFDGADQVILNGDTLDTRPSAQPSATNRLRREVTDFFAHHAPPCLLLTGNHDPDLTVHHHTDLADGRVFVMHGDALFDEIVPWSRDAPLARQLVAAELAALPPPARDELHSRLAAFRRAAAALPQRHQAEPHGLKYLAGFIQDTIWPPSRVFRVLRAWRETPGRAARFVTRHRPQARFFAMGHTHRLGAHRTDSGFVVLNTGSFCPPCAAGVIDVTANRVVLRRVERRADSYRLGASVAEFALAAAPAVKRLRP